MKCIDSIFQCKNKAMYNCYLLFFLQCHSARVKLCMGLSSACFNGPTSTPSHELRTIIKKTNNRLMSHRWKYLPEIYRILFARNNNWEGFTGSMKVTYAEMTSDSEKLKMLLKPKKKTKVAYSPYDSFKYTLS